MDVHRISTGVEELDKIIGGFPKGSLIVIAGNPGTGKTVFSARFLYRGAVDHGENGVYVSFAENRETFYENMRNFGFDFRSLEKEAKFRYLNLLTLKEHEISSIFKVILEEVVEVKAKRLVIDSFSAITQAFEKPHDVRILISMILGRIIRRTGCTTLIVVEVPYGEGRMGLDIEEFVADGVLHFRARELEERLFRDISIKKMRGTEVKENKVGFTIKDGFKVFPSFKIKPVEKKGKFKPIPDQLGRFSTGSEDLDRLLDGGYVKGSTVLFEIGRNVSTAQYHLVISPTPWNFLAKRAAVIVAPSSGVDYSIVWKRAAESGLPEELLNRHLRVCTFRPLALKREPYVIEFEGKNIDEDFEVYLKVATRLRKETNRPILNIVGIDRLLANYGTSDVLKILNSSATIIREYGDLGVFLLKPGYPRVSEILNAIVDVHFKIVREHGALFIYGLKPRTRLNFLEMDVSKGYPLPKLTPVV